jgi:hypothetical protein
MPTALAVDRSRVCTYTFENSSKCRIPLSAGHPYLCTFHARKDTENRASDDAARDIAFHLSGRYVSFCDLSAAIAQTITAVAYNHIPTRSAATIAYLTQNLVQSLAGAEREYKETFGIYAWRQTIADNFSNPRPSSSAEPAASHLHPVPADDRTSESLSNPVSNPLDFPEISAAQPPSPPEQAPTENSTQGEEQRDAANNSETGASDSHSGVVNNLERAAASNAQTITQSDSESDGPINSKTHGASDAQSAAPYRPAPAHPATTPPAPPSRATEPRTHLPSQPQIEAALARLRAAMATQ